MSKLYHTVVIPSPNENWRTWINDVGKKKIENLKYFEWVMCQFYGLPLDVINHIINLAYGFLVIYDPEMKKKGYIEWMKYWHSNKVAQQLIPLNFCDDYELDDVIKNYRRKDVDQNQTAKLFSIYQSEKKNDIYTFHVPHYCNFVLGIIIPNNYIEYINSCKWHFNNDCINTSFSFTDNFHITIDNVKGKSYYYNSEIIAMPLHKISAFTNFPIKLIMKGNYKNVCDLSKIELVCTFMSNATVGKYLGNLFELGRTVIDNIPVSLCLHNGVLFYLELTRQKA